MRKFTEMCAEEVEDVSLLARGGQKVVFEAKHKRYGDCVIKLYFQRNAPCSLREIQIEKNLNLQMVPKIYDTGTVEYKNVETLYIIEEKICGLELRKLLSEGMRFSLKEAVYFLEQGLIFIANIEKPGFSEKEAFRHYLFCLRKQCQSGVRNTYKETMDAHLIMLKTAEQLLTGLGAKGIIGQDRDFTEILDVNRAAISAFDMAYRFSLSQEWTVL